jgi:enoyl-CoA hydratase/carnithine racemase
VTLRDLASPDSLLEAAPTALSSAHLSDLGDCVFSIEIAAVPADSELLLSALDRVRQEASLKVLLITGGDGCWSQSDRSASTQASERRLLSAIAAFPYPVIAVMSGDASGLGFLLGCVCDLMVCSEYRRYVYTESRYGLLPRSSE